MDAKTLFSQLKTQSVPVNCLRKGDIVHMDYNIAIVTNVTHLTSSEHAEVRAYGECVILEWESDGDTGVDIIPSYLPGSRGKWSERSIVVRESLSFCLSSR